MLVDLDQLFKPLIHYILGLIITKTPYVVRKGFKQAKHVVNCNEP